MRPRKLIRPLAYLELDDQVQYFAQFSESTTRRLIEACEQAIDKLAEMPELGSPCQFSNPRLQGLRVWPVRGFKKHLIFYRPVQGGIEVLHIVHGARDLAALFESESE